MAEIVNNYEAREDLEGIEIYLLAKSALKQSKENLKQAIKDEQYWRETYENPYRRKEWDRYRKTSIEQFDYDPGEYQPD